MNHGKRSDKFVLHMQHGIVRSGSKSQGAPRMTSRLSINRLTLDPFPGGEPAFVRVLSVPLLGGLGRVHGPQYRRDPKADQGIIKSHGSSMDSLRFFHLLMFP